MAADDSPVESRASGSHQLLSTKLAFPLPRPKIIPRAHLIQHLNADLYQGNGFSRKLTLFSAPAGYGKTTQAAGWLRGSQRPTAWISLDEGDNDPARFLAYLIAALRGIWDGFGAGLQAMLSSPQPPPAEMLATALVNAVSAIPEPFFLVLDDYHVIQARPVQGLVAFLLERQPAGMHLVLLTREDPLLPVPRLRARGELLEIRQEDLRFSLAEAQEFLRQMAGLDLSPADIGALERRTEGWIAGLQLAALSMQGRADLGSFIADFTGSSRFILDYLIEEVFVRQPAEVRDFLLKTAVLERLCAPLCGAVADQPDSQRILLYLESANLFIVPLDERREWYRYHRLFAEFLHNRLRVQSGDLENTLHQRASQWYRAAGYMVDAVQHALEGRDWALAAELILECQGELLRRGELMTLANWFTKLPGEVVHARPELCLSFAWQQMLSGQYAPAAQLLEQGEGLAAGNQPMLGQFAAAQAYLAQAAGDGRKLIETSQRALALLPENDLTTRSVVAMNLGIAYWHIGRMADAQSALEEASRTARQSGNTYAEINARIFLARVQAVYGRLHPAAASLKEIQRQTGGAAGIALVPMDLCTIAYEWNDLESASRYQAQTLEASQRSGNLEFQIAAWMLQARVSHARGDSAGVRAAFEHISTIQEQVPIPLRTRARSADLQVQLALADGDLSAARELARQLDADTDAHPFYRFLGLTHARLLLAEGRRAEAAGLLEKAANTARQSSWGCGLIAALLLQAVSAGSTSAAQGYLQEALSLGQPEGFIRSFADSGAALLPLLKAALRQPAQAEYVERILTAMGEKPARSAAQPAGLAEPLSEREMEVLRLLAEGLSNREIAERLFISPGTAKTHIHNLCGKLGAASRTQAVARARGLDLI